MESENIATRQRVTVLYFIDRLVLRIGYDIVGCCQLRSEHIKLESPNVVKFNFLGKDSIRYQNKVEVDDQVYKNLQIFKENKSEKDQLFDKVKVSIFRHLVKFFIINSFSLVYIIIIFSI